MGVSVPNEWLKKYSNSGGLNTARDIDGLFYAITGNGDVGEQALEYVGLKSGGGIGAAGIIVPSHLLRTRREPR
jgi:hypothetical protein